MASSTISVLKNSAESVTYNIAPSSETSTISVPAGITSLMFPLSGGVPSISVRIMARSSRSPA